MWKVILHVTNLGKDQSSKYNFYLNAYVFHTIVKLKNLKLKHCKSGIIYNLYSLDPSSLRKESMFYISIP